MSHSNNFRYALPRAFAALGVAFAMHASCAAQGGTTTTAVGNVNGVGMFAPTAGAVPAPWTLVQLNKKVPPTQYRLDVWEGVAAIRANAQASMALMARPLTIDLQATPVLCWRWRIGGVVPSADMATKKGDDYAARVYIAFSLPAPALSFATRTKLGIARAIYGDQVPDAAVNSVWDNRHPVGTRAVNAYTDRAQMVVQRSGNAQAGQWVNERANVLADVRQAFGTDPIQATLLAVASDTDNTGETAEAGFADLHFVAADAPCGFGK